MLSAVVVRLSVPQYGSAAPLLTLLPTTAIAVAIATARRQTLPEVCYVQTGLKPNRTTHMTKVTDHISHEHEHLSSLPP